MANKGGLMHEAAQDASYTCTLGCDVAHEISGALFKMLSIALYYNI